MTSSGRRPPRRSGSEWLRLPLEHASAAGGLELVNGLVEAGADTCSTLHLAIHGGYEQVVRSMLNSGAPPNSEDENGDAPLQIAAKMGHEEIASLLLFRRADANMLNDHERNPPLILAARFERISTILLNALLRAGADVSARDNCGRTSPFAMDSLPQQRLCC